MSATIFKDFFKIVADKAYSGSDLRSVIFRANKILSSNFKDVNLKNDLFESSIYLAKKDIELYIRIMNLCIDNSLHCFNYLFVKSSIYLVSKNYGGVLASLDRNYQQIFSNVILIILNDELINEIDMVGLSERLVIGKDPRIFVSYQQLVQFENKIFELLNKKYVHKLLQFKGRLDSNELINTIDKLNFLYTNYSKNIKISHESICYSEINNEINGHIFLSPTAYDKEIYDSYGFLFFPKISDVKIINEKIIVTNDGFGNLDNCTFTILYPPKDEKLMEKVFNVSNGKDKVVYIEKDLKNKLIHLPLNDDLEFRFDFEKFDQHYTFTFKKEIGKITDQLDKPRDFYMINNNSFNNNSDSFNNFAYNSNQINQKVVNNKIDIQKLKGSYIELAKLIEETDMEVSKKQEVKAKIDDALEEVSRENCDFSKLKKITDHVTNLIGTINKALPIYETITKIREMMGY